MECKKLVNIIVVMLFFVVAFNSNAEVIIKDNQKIAFLGDSITRDGGYAPCGYCHLVMDGLKRAGVKDLKSVMAGLGGDYAAGMRQRMEGAILPHNPDWMTLSCGVNDVWWHLDKGIDAYKMSMRSILDRAAEKNIKVIVLSATKICENDEKKLHEHQLKFNAFLKEEAKVRNLPFVDLWEAETKALATASIMDETKGLKLTRDGIHMNAFGNQMMALAILRTMGVDEEVLKEAQREWCDFPKAFSARTGVKYREMETLQKKACAEKVSQNTLLRNAVFNNLDKNDVVNGDKPNKAKNTEEVAESVVGKPLIRKGESVFFMGDRIMYEFQLSEGGWTIKLISALRASGIPITRHHVAVYAPYSFATASELLKRLEDRLASRKDSWIIYQGTIADSCSDDMKRTPINEYRSTIATTFAKAKANNMKGLILSRLFAGDDLESKANKIICEYNNVLKEEAEKIGFLFVDLTIPQQELAKNKTPDSLVGMTHGTWVHPPLSLAITDYVLRAVGIDEKIISTEIEASRDSRKIYTVEVPFSLNEWLKIKEVANKRNMPTSDFISALCNEWLSSLAK